MDGAHHLHMRKRLFNKFEPYPNPDAFKRFFDKVMIFVSVGVPFALLPQVIQVFETQDVSDLSLTTWGLLAFFNVLWTTYGVLHRTFPIAISSAMTFLLQLTLVFAILIYR